MQKQKFYKFMNENIHNRLQQGVEIIHMWLVAICYSAKKINWIFFKQNNQFFFGSINGLKCFYAKKNICFSSTKQACEKLWIFRINKRTSLLHSAITYEWKSSIYFLCHVLRSRKVLLSSNSRCFGCKGIWNEKNPLIARMWFILLCVAHFFSIST